MAPGVKRPLGGSILKGGGSVRERTRAEGALLVLAMIVAGGCARPPGPGRKGARGGAGTPGHAARADGPKVVVSCLTSTVTPT